MSNVFGFTLPVYDIAAECRRAGVPLIVDASQSAGALTVDFSRLGAAFAAMPGHKGLMGPQGTGLLLCSQTGRPLLCGGTGSESRRQTMPDMLPDRLEAGTHNVCGIAGLLEGIRYVSDLGAETIGAREREMCALTAEMLADIPGLEVFSGPGQAGVLSVRMPGADCETICARLGEMGVAVRGGLHCAPTAHETAGTIETGTVRFSFSPFTARREAEAACLDMNTILRGEK